MLRWPARVEVEEALADWVRDAVASHPRCRALAVFGSFAAPLGAPRRWGVGSDLDLLALVTESSLPFERRAVDWRPDTLPVPADLLVYTEDEWRRALSAASPFVTRLAREARWLYRAADGGNLAQGG